MAQYVSVPTEEESSIRRAEVASLLARHAQRRVGGQAWWQSFENDVEVGGFRASAHDAAGLDDRRRRSSRRSSSRSSSSRSWGLLAGLAVPFVLRFYVVARGRRR